MITLDSHLTFIGVDEETGKPRCGFLTDLIDAQDMPVAATVENGTMTLTLSTGQSIQFKMPEALLAYASQGADFWIGNVGGSEEAWLISLDFGNTT